MSALLNSERPEAPLFSDGIGDRVVSTDSATGEVVQVLRLNLSLTAVPSFEFALRERVARLANFRHGYYARVRRVDRAPGHTTALSVVSDHVEGTRLSEILRLAGERRIHLDTNAALCLVRQLVPALAVLHENARDVAHGLIAPERLIVTPHARLAIAEHVLGGAIEQMQYGRERLWHEFRVAMPPSAGIPRFDQRSDVAGIGVVALALILGRPIAADEYPARLNELMHEATERTSLGVEQPLSASLRSWLARALQVDLRRAFASAPEALAALEQLTADGSAYIAAPVALELFLSRYNAALLSPALAATLAPVAEPEPIHVHVPATVEADDAPPAPAVAAVPAVESEPSILETSFALPELTQPSAHVEPAAPVPIVWTTPPPVGEAKKKPAKSQLSAKKSLAAAAVVTVLASGGFAGLRAYTRSAPPAMATLSVQSNPLGVPVFVDGVDRGVTPAKITLAPGAHILELRGRGGVPRVIPVSLTAGADVSQYLELPDLPMSTDLTTIVSAPTAAAAVDRAPEPSGPSVGGWIALKMPFVLEIREGGRLLGTTDAERLMLPAGRHVLEFSNAALLYQTGMTVQVSPGRVTPLTLALPKGVVNLNATPWAEVWIDGQRAGETPIGNLSVSIGAHEFVFRHPQLGEKRHAVSVTAGAPVRLSVDMK
ncbi:MAG: PEGA domain-containing protein [Vicinamibacterales bacterium]